MSAWHHRLFDLSKYYVVQFDQRGCGKSAPFAELQENTTSHLIADMEQLREYLNIPEWYVFGGSWGSTLALAYAYMHPQCVRGLVLYGIFLCRREEWRQIFNPEGPAASLFPDYFEKLTTIVGTDEINEIIARYEVLFTAENKETRQNAIRQWCHWEGRIMDVVADEANFDLANEEMSIMEPLAKLEMHYFRHNGFIDGNLILQTIGQKMAEKPVTLIQGRYDLVCPAATAYELHKAIPHSTLTMIAKAGHTAKHPDTMRALLKAVAACG
jgi:proline iminopeptidase